jgi:hypothetical protein
MIVVDDRTDDDTESEVILLHWFLSMISSRLIKPIFEMNRDIVATWFSDCQQAQKCSQDNETDIM